MVSEYVQRQRLAKLGFTTPLGDIDADRAEAFLIISTHLDDLRERDAAAKAKKKGGRRG